MTLNEPRLKILVTDDDPRLRNLLSIALERAGYTVITAADGQTALVHAAREKPDLIVLDIGLPELDGLEVCRRLRQRSDVPILFLSARDDEVDRILGLELGADDYVTKPFSPRELVARVRAILKRSNAAAQSQVLRHGVVVVDPDRHACLVSGSMVPLTATEMAILMKLLLAPDRVVARPQMVDAIWGGSTPVSDRTLDSHLRNLRRKLSDAGCSDAVETLHGVGIRLGSCRG